MQIVSQMAVVIKGGCRKDGCAETSGLAPGQIALLAHMGASIDADEYAGDFIAYRP